MAPSHDQVTTSTLILLPQLQPVHKPTCNVKLLSCSSDPRRRPRHRLSCQWLKLLRFSATKHYLKVAAYTLHSTHHTSTTHTAELQASRSPPCTDASCGLLQRQRHDVPAGALQLRAGERGVRGHDHHLAGRVQAAPRRGQHVRRLHGLHCRLVPEQVVLPAARPALAQLCRAMHELCGA